MIEILEQAMKLYEAKREKKQARKENVQPIIQETTISIKSNKRSRDNDEEREINLKKKKV